jgi:hypothetical protein
MIHKLSLLRTLRPLLACLLLAMAGCNWIPEVSIPLAPTGVPNPAPTETPPVTPTEVPPPTPKPSSHGMTLELWVPEFLNPADETELGEAFAAQLDAFMDVFTYRDLRVNTTVKRGTGSGGLHHLLSTASEVAPSILPDLLVLNQHDILLAAAEGLLQPIDTPLPIGMDFYTVTLDSVQDHTGLWALPYLARVDQMAYRPGITETAPLDWSGVLSGNYTMLLPGAPPEGLAADVLLQIYLGSGGRAVDQMGQASLDRASLERTYSFLLELQRAGQLDPLQALSLTSAAACWSAYQEGKGDLSPVPFGQFWSGPREDALPAWAPTEEGTPLTVFYTWGIAIVTPDPARYESALMLARWMVAAQQMADVARAGNLTPTRLSALQVWQLAADELAFADEVLSHGVMALPPAIDVPVRRALQAGLVALLQSEATTAESAATTALTALRR